MGDVPQWRAYADAPRLCAHPKSRDVDRAALIAVNHMPADVLTVFPLAARFCEEQPHAKYFLTPFGGALAPPKSCRFTAAPSRERSSPSPV
jgi:hypothetical protein